MSTSISPLLLPPARRFREPVNGFLALAGFLLSLAGTVAMLWASREKGPLMASLAVYGLSMCACFFTSALHHLVVGDRQLDMRLLRWDQAAIFPFIAGSFTPTCLWLLPRPAGLYLLAFVWFLALVGLVYRLGFAADPKEVSDPPHTFDTALYVVMGWQIVWQIMPLAAVSKPGSFLFLVAGGVAYTVGGVILSQKLLDFWPGVFGHHEIWHLFVIAGASGVFAFIWLNLLV